MYWLKDQSSIDMNFSRRLFPTTSIPTKYASEELSFIRLLESKSKTAGTVNSSKIAYI